LSHTANCEEEARLYIKQPQAAQINIMPINTLQLHQTNML